ncbi:hypothetical protein [Piscinibacter koreensis]|uniref:Uncharacterized protein n=1 Tax=Piscinibacter koreensis TaxID=2742824 RepID=A0A7Y6NPL4_9BURK|nr:hypothetical protein [Schlegelella koreensis]NUZ07013.1 hypothetical protein [Schlegelella koreensis]
MDRAGDRFFARTAVVAAPFGVWALHFFYSYAAVPVGCRAGWATRDLFGASLLRWALAGGSVLALVAVAALAWQAWRALRAEPLVFSVRVQALAALLGALAVVWTSVPAFVASGCPAG